MMNRKRLRCEQVSDQCNQKVSTSAPELPYLYNDLAMDVPNRGDGSRQLDANLEPFSQYFNDEELEMCDCIGKEDIAEAQLLKKVAMELPLLSQHIYFLNKSHSKWVSVGLDANLFFEPIVKIVGIKKQSISMKEEEWERFLSCKTELMKCFKDKGSTLTQFRNYGMKMSFECFDGINRILKIEKGNECLYISYEGLLELWHIVELVECRLKNLKVIDYGKYYRELIDRLSKMEGDIESNIVKENNGVVSESTCITKELMMYGLNKINFDLKFYKGVVM